MALTTPPRSHSLHIGPLRRDLPLFAVAPELSIAVLNILGDTELVETAAQGLAQRLEGLDYSALVTAEAKSIPLVYALARNTRKPWVVLRKHYKSYMGEALHSESLSITTGKTQQLFLDQKDRDILAAQSVVLVDDVISTGSTLKAMRALMEHANARVAGVAAICTEGDAPPEDPSIIALAHLPLFHC